MIAFQDDFDNKSIFQKIIYVNMLFVLLVYIPEIHKIYILDTVGN